MPSSAPILKKLTAGCTKTRELYASMKIKVGIVFTGHRELLMRWRCLASFLVWKCWAAFDCKMKKGGSSIQVCFERMKRVQPWWYDHATFCVMWLTESVLLWTVLLRKVCKEKECPSCYFKIVSWVRVAFIQQYNWSAGQRNSRMEKLRFLKTLRDTW